MNLKFPKLLVLITFIITSCSYNIGKFDDIHPYRKVTITTIAGINVSCSDADQLYSATNKWLTPQTGIILCQTKCIDRDIRMPTDFRLAMFALTSMFPQPNTDMVVWLDRDSRKILSRELFKLLMIPQPQAAIDDIYRRYIVMRGLDPQVLLHEIGHAFIFSHEHSSSGVMMKTQLQLFPGTPAIPNRRFAESDRQEILKNKFRDFSKKVIIYKHSGK